MNCQCYTLNPLTLFLCQLFTIDRLSSWSMLDRKVRENVVYSLLIRGKSSALYRFNRWRCEKIGCGRFLCARASTRVENKESLFCGWRADRVSRQIRSHGPLSRTRCRRAERRATHASCYDVKSIGKLVARQRRDEAVRHDTVGCGRHCCSCQPHSGAGARSSHSANPSRAPSTLAMSE